MGLVLAGCTLGPTPPVVTGAVPSWGYNGETTDINIEGAHFFPTVVVDDNGGRVDDTFQAWLVVDGEDVSLQPVARVGYDQLRAEVPAGLPTGRYDLRVEVPSGLTATAAEAFVVSDTRADHLALSVSTAAYQVGAYAPVTIRLQDPEDIGVNLPLDVQITATSRTGAEAVTFYPEGLEDQQLLTDAMGVSGRLGIDGTGVVLLTSEADDDVVLEVTPLDAASTVRGESLVLSWTPGPVANVELGLPRAEGFETRAGDTFALTVTLQDALGNVLTSESPDLVLLDECSGGQWVTPVSVVGGQTEFEVELSVACPVNHIVAYAYATRWESPAFEVLPAEQSGYELAAIPDPAIAGERGFILVEAVDAFGNLVTDHSRAVVLRDDLGGLDPDTGRGTQSCLGFVGGVQTCPVTLWASGPSVVIRAEDAQGHLGEAPPIEVLPANPTTLQLLVGATTVEAGEPFDVTVRLLDPYENSVGFDPGGTDPVLFLDDTGTAACVWRGADTGAQTFECTIEGAVADAHLEARVRGLTGAAVVPLTVTNGPLTVVELDPLATQLVAGVAFTVELRGFDAYGNAYLVQTDPDVDLSDSSGTLSPGAATLEPDGTVQLSAVIYGAGSAVRVYASQGATRLGASRPLNVLPNAQDGFAVLTPPWIEVDEPTQVTLTAVDAYGNAITAYAGPVTLAAEDGSCDPLVVDGFVNGTAAVDATCGTPALAEVLVATDDSGFEGRSDGLDVLDFACADGPVADLVLDGELDSIRCLTAGSSVTVDADASGSAAGGSAIVLHHFTDAETSSDRTAAGTSSFTYTSAGTRYVEALAVDTRACADRVGAYAYVGLDDGEPTGPVTVSTSSSTAASTGSVTVTVAATDCTADVAAGQTLLVRADLGTPSGTSTGAGIAVTLDGAGTGTLSWAFDSGHSGSATFYAGSAGGGGVGTASVTLTDDRVLPTIVAVTPSGVELGTVSSVEIVFSEPMLYTSVSTTNITVTGPSGAVVGAFTLSSDLTTVVFTPIVPLVGSAGTYTLGIAQNMRDLAGNQLDGEWSGVRGPASFTFGDVAEAVPELSSCTTGSARFTPDGDDGAGDEADTATLSPTATAAPTWWWLSVYDVDGTRVRSLREDGTATLLTWDGRGDNGLVRDPGWYRLSTAPIDTYGNVGGRCDVAIELGQHVDLP
jgi:hypothetical protein